MGAASQLNPSELRQMLPYFYKSKRPLMVYGEPGVGKTTIAELAAADCGFDVMPIYASTKDATDAKGVAMPNEDGTKANFLLTPDLERIMFADRPLAVIMDDFGQTPPAVQAGYMNTIRSGYINGKKISPFVTFILCTNDRKHKAGVSGILEPIKSGMFTSVELVADLECWLRDYARPAGISDQLDAFLQAYEDLFCKFVPTNDMTTSPSPRTWAHVMEIESMGMPNHLERKAISGAVGEDAAQQYFTFKHLFKTAVDVQDIIDNPDRALIPSKPDVLYGTAVALAGRADQENFGRIMRYMVRLGKADKGEYAALCVRAATERDETLKHTDAYVRILTTPLGAQINGMGVH